jgi:ABC-2 type transport system permease protein
MLQGVLAGAGFRAMAGVFQRPEMVGGQIGRARAAMAGDDTMNGIERALMGTMLDAADRLFGAGVVGAAGPSDASTPDPTAPSAAGLASFTPVEVSVRTPRRGDGDGRAQIETAFELTYPQAAAWALVGCVTGFGMSLVGERSSGTLKRLAVAPIRRDAVVLGKALACFIAAVSVLAAQRALFALPFFGVRGGEPWIEAVTIVLVAFAVVGVMMVLATLATSAGGTDGAVRGTLLVLALLGGAGVPLMFFTGWLGTVTLISPFRWAITALEGSTWRGWSPVELARAWSVLGGIGSLGLVWGVWRFRRWSMTG